MTKSICRARFSALSGVAQVWDNKIQGQIKSGEQPFPMQNSNNLKVCWSPIGFLQNMILMSSGHLFKGENASPFIILKISLNPLSGTALYSITRLVQLQMRFYVFDFSKIAKERDSVRLKQIIQSWSSEYTSSNCSVLHPIHHNDIMIFNPFSFY